MLLLAYMSTEDSFFENESLNKFAPWVLGVVGAAGLISILSKFSIDWGDLTNVIHINDRDIKTLDIEDINKSVAPYAFDRKSIQATISLIADSNLILKLTKILNEIPTDQPRFISGKPIQDISMVDLPNESITLLVNLLHKKELEMSEASPVNQKELSLVINLIEKWNLVLSSRKA